jgi:hypothetical protein
MDPSLEPPANADVASPAQHTASSETAPAKLSVEASSASALAQDAQSSEIAASQSSSPVDVQCALSSGSAVDLEQPTTAAVCAQLSAETSSVSALAQGAQSSESAASQSLLAAVDAQCAQSNGSAVDQGQKSAAAISAELSAESSSASTLAQDAQSSESARSQSFPSAADVQCAQPSGSAVDQEQQSATTDSGSTFQTPAEQPNEDSVIGGLPALVKLAEQLPAQIEMNAAKPRGRPFQPGQSGNPAGRPRGSRNRVTQYLEAFIENQGEALAARAVQKALEGDSPLLRALLDRIVPPRRERAIEFDVTKIVTASDARAASTALLAASARGEISLKEAALFMGLLASHVKLVETAGLEPRVDALEKERKK